MVLGAISKIQFSQASARLEPGDVLAIYSDGLFERSNGTEEFGLARLEELIVRHRHAAAARIVDDIYEDVIKFGRPATLQDDVTLVVIKRLVS